MVLAAIALVFSVNLASCRPVEDRPERLVETARLDRSLRALPTKRAARGDIAHQQGLVETEALVQTWLRELGFEPRTQALKWNLAYQAEQEKKSGVPESRQAPETTKELAANTWHNVYVDLPGKELPKETLILACHFDAAPNAPGADDNGTGVAALLEIARVLKDRPMRRTVRLIFFNLEEIGLKGSIDYVRAGGLPTDEKVIGMVSLEMLGYFSDNPGSQKSPIGKIEGVFDPPTVGDFIGIATIKSYSEFSRRLDKEMRAAAPGLKTVVADFMPIAPPDFMRSDHAPFMLAGMPGVMLTDTSNFRNPHYHKPTDTIDTLDMERFTLVVRGVAGAAYVIAEPVGPAVPNEKPRAGPGAK
jgi:aminopeptidase YwaD